MSSVAQGESRGGGNRSLVLIARRLQHRLRLFRQPSVDDERRYSDLPWLSFLDTPLRNVSKRKIRFEGKIH